MSLIQQCEELSNFILANPDLLRLRVARGPGKAEVFNEDEDKRIIHHVLNLILQRKALRLVNVLKEAATTLYPDNSCDYKQLRSKIEKLLRVRREDYLMLLIVGQKQLDQKQLEVFKRKARILRYTCLKKSDSSYPKLPIDLEAELQQVDYDECLEVLARNTVKNTVDPVVLNQDKEQPLSTANVVGEARL